MHAELVVWDHGPGIPLDERRLSSNGSIVHLGARVARLWAGTRHRQTGRRQHGGTLRIDDTCPVAIRPALPIHVVLPGRPSQVARDPSQATRGDTVVTGVGENPEN